MIYIKKEEDPKNCPELLPYGDKDKILDNYGKDLYLQGYLSSDIILKKNGKYSAYDVKYKDNKWNLGRRNDRFQLLSYNLIWNCKAIGHVFPGSDFKFEKAKIKNKYKPQGEYCQITIPLKECKFSNEFYQEFKKT